MSHFITGVPPFRLTQNPNSNSLAFGFQINSPIDLGSLDEHLVISYFTIGRLTVGQRSKALSQLTSAKMASVMRFHLAFQLTVKEGLTTTQRQVILDTLANVDSEIYDPAKKLLSLGR